LLLFIVIRYINIYGDSLPRSGQQSPILTFLSFMNVTKYPPSLQFCLVTLGIMFVLLAVADHLTVPLKNIITVYGKVPLFYFIVHFYLIHIITLIVLILQGFQWQQLSFSTGTFGRPAGIESGLPLWAIYLIWIAVVAALYQPCRWFGRYKAKHTYWWLRYL